MIKSFSMKTLAVAALTTVALSAQAQTIKIANIVALLLLAILAHLAH